MAGHAIEELREAEGGDRTGFVFGDKSELVWSLGCPPIHANLRHVDGPVRKPGCPLRSPAPIADRRVGLLERNVEKGHNGIPEPVRIGDGSFRQCIV